jgi:heme/copper-type cytochrome/quinol oxidase subunit 2
VTGLGKLLIVFGAILIVAGIVVILAGKANVPLGRMPGDITYRGKNTTVYFPIVTCIVISIVLSLVMWLVNRFSR